MHHKLVINDSGGADDSSNVVNVNISKFFPCFYLSEDKTT